MILSIQVLRFHLLELEKVSRAFVVRRGCTFTAKSHEWAAVMKILAIS